jgi:hypothetical protein
VVVESRQDLAPEQIEDRIVVVAPEGANHFHLVGRHLAHDDAVELQSRGAFCVMFSRSAARLKCSSSATATKQRIWLSSNILAP